MADIKKEMSIAMNYRIVRASNTLFDELFDEKARCEFTRTADKEQLEIMGMKVYE